MKLTYEDKVQMNWRKQGESFKRLQINLGERFWSKVFN